MPVQCVHLERRNNNSKGQANPVQDSGNSHFFLFYFLRRINGIKYSLLARGYKNLKRKPSHAIVVRSFVGRRNIFQGQTPLETLLCSVIYSDNGFLDSLKPELLSAKVFALWDSNFVGENVLVFLYN